MTTPEISTQYAPAERTPREILQKQRQAFSEQTALRPFLDSIPDIFLILNDKRQIVYSNEALLVFLGITNPEQICGLRPGEALNCVHAFESEGGCGTTEFCKNCGAVNAILASLRGEACVQECRILQKDSGDAFDLRVWTTPYRLNGDLYSIFVVSDISHEKRRKNLERIFFHDVLNTAGGLLGFARLLRDADSSKSEMLRERIYILANKLIEEIKAQRELSAAENNELQTHPTPIRSIDILMEVTEEYKNNDAFKDRGITWDARSADTVFTSDRTLILRVIGNLVKNALEASQPGETVTLGCTSDDSSIQFWVRNPGFMPRDVQLQIFQRSFSTKGSGRGLGTYSIKLLTERYLKGQVSFTSTPGDGTTFTARYPLALS